MFPQSGIVSWNYNTHSVVVKLLTLKCFLATDSLPTTRTRLPCQIRIVHYPRTSQSLTASYYWDFFYIASNLLASPTSASTCLTHASPHQHSLHLPDQDFLFDQKFPASLNPFLHRTLATIFQHPIISHIPVGSFCAPAKTKTTHV